MKPKLDKGHCREGGVVQDRKSHQQTSPGFMVILHCGRSVNPLQKCFRHCTVLMWERVMHVLNVQTPHWKEGFKKQI